MKAQKILLPPSLIPAELWLNFTEVVLIYQGNTRSRRWRHEGDSTSSNKCKHMFVMNVFILFQDSNHSSLATHKWVWVEQATVQDSCCHLAEYAVCITMHFGRLSGTIYSTLHTYLIHHTISSHKFQSRCPNLKKCHKWHNDSCSSWVNNWLLFTVERHA